MLHLARHHGLVVGILQLMLSLCVVQGWENSVFAGSIKATWNANTEPDLSGYKIYYGESSGNYTNSINVGKVTQYTFNQLKAGVLYYFAVTAYDTAGNESGFSQEASGLIPVVDSAPPTVISVTPFDQNSLAIKFSELVAPASAQDKANYAIDNGITVASATLQQDDNSIVVLATSAHETGKAYKITIRNIADRAVTPNIMTQAATLTYSFQKTDNVPPAVSNVRIIDPTTVEVLFSEAVTPGSAQNKNNYSINPSIAISSAVLQGDKRTVNLTTAEHANGVTYAITIRNISDRAAPANVMAQAATFDYLYQTEDRQPPEVNSVTLTDLTHILIVFNEKITLSSAQNVNNYRLSDNIQVQAAQLASNGVEATLTTSPHQFNKDYTLTLINIRDRSPAANVIAANTTFTYFLADNNGNNGGLSVNGLNPARYVVDNLQVGDAYYIDRPYVIRQVPNGKTDLVWIKTANSDRANTSERFVEFILMRESYVYVAYDSRATLPPNWLKDYFTNTGESIMVSESAGRLNLWQSRFVPGKVTLGGNMASGVQTSASLSMYVVLIEDVQSPPGSDSQKPQSFVLKQNYPNPFSLSGGTASTASTKIEFYLEDQRSISLTVHNTIGQVVRKLYGGLLPAGNHNATWDGRDDNGNLLPSGTYLCTLEVRDEVNDAGMTMTASLNRLTRVMTLLK